MTRGVRDVWHAHAWRERVEGVKRNKHGHAGVDHATRRGGVGRSLCPRRRRSRGQARRRRARAGGLHRGNGRAGVLELWNFRHLANVRRAERFNAVAILAGYHRPLRIVSPAEVLYDEEDEPR